MSYAPPFYKNIFHNLRRYIAQRWLTIMPATQIAITGSQGKTTTTYIINKILSYIHPTIATDINLDTIYNVPITALKTNYFTKYAVFELGVDHIGEMDLHLQIVKPQIAVVTGVSTVHTDKEHLQSLKNVVKEKAKLIQALPKKGLAILNWDDEHVKNMASYTHAKIKFYGSDPKTCSVYIKSIKLFTDHTEINFFDKERNLNINVTTKLIGKHYQYAIMASYLVYRFFFPETHSDSNRYLKRFIRLINSVSSLPGRMSIEKGPLKTMILNDSLCANPQSVTSGLQTFSEIEYKKGRKIAVLAEMGELENPEEEHKKIGEFISQLKLNYIVGIGPLLKYTIQTAKKNGVSSGKFFYCENVKEAADTLKVLIRPEDFIYLKGSLLRHIERISLILKDQPVNCKVVYCQFYNHCSKCKYLLKPLLPQ